jgi:hypothetical protein
VKGCKVVAREISLSIPSIAYSTPPTSTEDEPYGRVLSGQRPVTPSVIRIEVHLVNISRMNLLSWSTSTKQRSCR